MILMFAVMSSHSKNDCILIAYLTNTKVCQVPADQLLKKFFKIFILNKVPKL